MSLATPVLSWLHGPANRRRAETAPFTNQQHSRVGSGEPVSTAVAALERAGAAVVLVDGKPAGVITRQDVLTFLSAQVG